MKSKFLIALLGVVGFVVSPVFANHHLKEACKKECPDAKDDHAVMECLKKTPPAAGSDCDKAHKEHHDKKHHDDKKKD